MRGRGRAPGSGSSTITIEEKKWRKQKNEVVKLRLRIEDERRALEHQLEGSREITKRRKLTAKAKKDKVDLEKKIRELQLELRDVNKKLDEAGYPQQDDFFNDNDNNNNNNNNNNNINNLNNIIIIGKKEEKEEEKGKEEDEYQYPPLPPIIAVDENRKLVKARERQRIADERLAEAESEAMRLLRKVEKKKTKFSNYFLTVNSHLKGKDFSEEEIVKIAEILQDTLNEELAKNSSKWVKVKSDADADHIQSIKIYTKPELQGVNTANQLHTHSIIMIEHDTRVQLDYNAIRELVNTKIAPRVREEADILSGAREYGGGIGNFKVQIQRASGKTAAEEFVYLDDMGIIWDRQQAASYYEGLKEKQDMGIDVPNEAYRLLHRVKEGVLLETRDNMKHG